MPGILMFTRTVVNLSIYQGQANGPQWWGSIDHSMVETFYYALILFLSIIFTLIA